MKLHLLASALLLLSTFSANALPPDPNSEEGKELAPFGPYLRGLQSSGGLSCCSLSDCRIVNAKTIGDHWSVFIKSEQFQDGNNTWVDVPAEAIIRNTQNPTGQPLVCWSKYRGVLCFVEPTGV